MKTETRRTCWEWEGKSTHEMFHALGYSLGHTGRGLTISWAWLVFSSVSKGQNCGTPKKKNTPKQKLVLCCTFPLGRIKTSFASFTGQSHADAPSVQLQLCPQSWTTFRKQFANSVLHRLVRLYIDTGEPSSEFRIRPWIPMHGWIYTHCQQILN